MAELTMELTLVLGTAQRRNSQLAEAMGTFESTVVMARKQNSPKHLARAAIGYANSEFFFGMPGLSSGPLLEEALSAVRGHEAIEECQVICRLSGVYFANSQFELANETARDAMAMARHLKDKEGLFEALGTLLMTNLGAPVEEGELRQRREALDEQLSIAEELGDPEKVFRALSVRVVSLAELGDRAAMDVAFAQFAAMSDQVAFGPIQRWVFASQRAMLAILEGEFSAAEAYAEAALVAGRDVQVQSATGVYGVQMFTIRREQGQLAEVAPLLKRFVDNNPGETVWRPGLTVMASDLGYFDMAKHNFDAIAEAEFMLPLDAKRSATLSYLAEACVALGDMRRAELFMGYCSPIARSTSQSALEHYIAGQPRVFSECLQLLWRIGRSLRSISRPRPQWILKCTHGLGLPMRSMITPPCCGGVVGKATWYT